MSDNVKLQSIYASRLSSFTENNRDEDNDGATGCSIGPVVRRRSSLFSSTRVGVTSDDVDLEKANGANAVNTDQIKQPTDANLTAATFIVDQFTDDEKECADPLQLPESTYSLLFTEKVTSLPFTFSVGVSLLSFACLGLAFWNNVTSGSAENPLHIPSNVSPAVRAAQYLSILVVILMEEG